MFMIAYEHLGIGIQKYLLGKRELQVIDQAGILFTTFDKMIPLLLIWKSGE